MDGGKTLDFSRTSGDLHIENQDSNGNNVVKVEFDKSEGKLYYEPGNTSGGLTTSNANEVATIGDIGQAGFDIVAADDYHDVGSRVDITETNTGSGTTTTVTTVSYVEAGLTTKLDDTQLLQDYPSNTSLDATSILSIAGLKTKISGLHPSLPALNEGQIWTEDDQGNTIAETIDIISLDSSGNEVVGNLIINTASDINRAAGLFPTDEKWQLAKLAERQIDLGLTLDANGDVIVDDKDIILEHTAEIHFHGNGVNPVDEAIIDYNTTTNTLEIIPAVHRNVALEVSGTGKAYVGQPGVAANEIITVGTQTGGGGNATVRVIQPTGVFLQILPTYDTTGGGGSSAGEWYIRENQDTNTDVEATSWSDWVVENGTDATRHQIFFDTFADADENPQSNDSNAVIMANAAVAQGYVFVQTDTGSAIVGVTRFSGTTSNDWRLDISSIINSIGVPGTSGALRISNLGFASVGNDDKVPNGIGNGHMLVWDNNLGIWREVSILVDGLDDDGNDEVQSFGLNSIAEGVERRVTTREWQEAHFAPLGATGGVTSVRIAINGTGTATNVPASAIAIVSATQQYYNITNATIEVPVQSSLSDATTYFNNALQWIQVGDGTSSGGGIKVENTAVSNPNLVHGTPADAHHFNTEPKVSGSNIMQEIDTDELATALGIPAIEETQHQILEELHQVTNFNWQQADIITDVFFTERTNKTGQQATGSFLDTSFKDSTNILTLYTHLTDAQIASARNFVDVEIVIGLGPDVVDEIPFQVMSYSSLGTGTTQPGIATYQFTMKMLKTR